MCHLHQLLLLRLSEVLPPLTLCLVWQRKQFCKVQNKCNILNAPFNVICIKNYISNNAVDRDSPMILSFHIILKSSNFINLLALSFLPCHRVCLPSAFATQFLHSFSQSYFPKYFSTIFLNCHLILPCLSPAFWPHPSLPACPAKHVLRSSINDFEGMMLRPYKK